MITKEDILNHQKIWAKTITDIGVLARANGDIHTAAAECVDRLYAYDVGEVLFKPTRAVEHPFRASREDALSYFIGGHIEEDLGFAINPGWKKVEFNNHGFQLYANNAVVMGTYRFTDYEGGSVEVEYTFGYVKDDQGALRINVHHSSIPFSP